MNNIYFAINDDWNDPKEIETIAAKFPLDVQVEICKILNRSIAKDASTPSLRA